MFILKNCCLIDGVSAEPIPDGMVAVREGKIVYAGPYEESVCRANPDLPVTDLEGKTVMPGLIDAHVHLSMDGAPDNFRNSVLDTAGFNVIQGVLRAQRDLAAGFTTIRCCGEKGEVDIDIRNAVREGLIAGPRILAAGKAITITGGHGDMLPGEAALDWIAEVADGVDEVRKAARRRIKRRVDNIKLMATGGGMSPGPATVAQLNEDEMRAAVIEAEKNGVCTSAHCIGEEGCANAVRAGVRTIEHGTFLNEETIARMAEQGTYLMSTLASFKTIKYGPEGGVPDDHRKKVEFFAQKHFVNLRKAIAAGVKVGCGTDCGTPFNYHGDNAYELECLVEIGGMTPMEAIIAATSVTAKAVMQPDIGSLEAGKTADLLVVDGAPLGDIKVLQNHDAIRQVYRDGRLLVDRDSGRMPFF